MTYNDDAPGDSTPPQQESKMHIGSKVTLISDEGSIGLISKRAPIRGVWIVRWFTGKKAGTEIYAHEDALRSL